MKDWGTCAQEVVSGGQSRIGQFEGLNKVCHWRRLQVWGPKIVPSQKVKKASTINVGLAEGERGRY